MSEQSSSQQETTKSHSSDSTAMQPQNQWALIRRSFGKWKLAVFSLYVIIFLITISIFAPFIANDRPITYKGQHKFEYKTAYFYLTSQLPRLAVPQKVVPKEEPQVEEKTDEKKTDKKTKQVAEKLKKKRSLQSILLFQLDLMSPHLESAKAKEISGLRQQLVTLADSAVAPEEKKEDVKELQAAFKKSFDPKTTTLLSKRYWPVFSTLSGTEIAFMLFNLALLSFPIHRRLVSRFIPRCSLLAGLILFFILPVVAGFLWWLNVPARYDRTDYKTGVMVADADKFPQSDVLYESSFWTPIHYGIDGYDLNAIDAPPAFAPGLAKQKEKKVTEAEKSEANQWDTPHWFGTDGIGRDILARMIWGGRISLAVGIVAVSIYVTIGIIVGSIAGYFGGIVDLLLSRFIEMVIVFPSFFLILTVIAFVGPSIFNIMVIIGLTGWTGIARLVRGEFLRLKAQEFVLAGRALGYSPFRIIYRHVLPNAMAPVLVSATFGIAGAILTESALSFLGLGISEPKPSWGGMLSSARTTFDSAPWMTYFPGFAIFITITAYNLVGEAFRDAADPRLRGK